MQPDDIKTSLIIQWVKKADEDLGLAEHLVNTRAPYHSAIAFHAQQAAEKYLKALLAHHAIAFPKTHDVAGLLDMLREADEKASADLDELVDLTPFAVESRYPGDSPALTDADVRRAVDLARLAKSVVCTAIQS